MQSIYRLNRWYDNLPGLPRFLLFIIPLMVLVVMIKGPTPHGVKMAGIVALGLFASLRILPFVFPKRLK